MSSSLCQGYGRQGDRAKQEFFENQSKEHAMKAAVHSYDQNYYGHYAHNCPRTVMSLVLKKGEERVFIEHQIDFDARGSHYGDVFETYALIQDPEKISAAMEGYEGTRVVCLRVTVDPRIIELMLQSPTKVIGRSGRHDEWRVCQPRE